MDSSKIRQKTFSGVFWNASTNIGTQLVSFAIQVVLARVLEPSAYGTIAMVTIFVAVTNVFVTTGYASALIQKKDVSEVECSTSFWMGVLIAGGGYFLLYMIAPAVASFYDKNELILILRMQAMALIFGALTSVHNALINRKLQFKKFFYINISGIFAQGVVGILLAYMNYGVWALVTSYLANRVVVLIVTWMVVDWKPAWIFSFTAFKGLFKFSGKLLVLTLIDTIYSNIRSIIIGKKYSEETLAFYSRGNQIPDLVATNGIGSINGILFPTLSRCANEKCTFKNAYRRAFGIMHLVSFPVYMGLAAVMPALSDLLFTQKWSESIVFAQMISISFIFNSFFVRSHAYNAKGRSDVSMWMSICDKVVVSILLVLAILYGDINFLVASAFISNAISTIIGVCVNCRVLDYKVKEQFKDAMPSFIIAVFMYCVVVSINALVIHNACKLIIQLCLGVIIYAMGCEIFKVESYIYLKGILKEYMKKKSSGVMSSEK